MKWKLIRFLFTRHSYVASFALMSMAMFVKELFFEVLTMVGR